MIIMSGLNVEIIKYLPNGLILGDSPRYEVRIIGTDIICWPWKTSIQFGED